MALLALEAMLPAVLTAVPVVRPTPRKAASVRLLPKPTVLLAVLTAHPTAP